MAKSQEFEYEYRTQGSAAVAPAYISQQESTARPLPGEKPAHKTHRKPRVAEKERLSVAPFAVMGIAVSMLMLVLVLFGYSQVYESASRVGDMEHLISELQTENVKLQNKYDTSIDLQHVEERAKELGMQQPTSKQIITLQIPVEDTAVVVQKAASNPFRAAWEAVTDTAQSLWAYLR